MSVVTLEEESPTKQQQLEARQISHSSLSPSYDHQPEPLMMMSSSAHVSLSTLFSSSIDTPASVTASTSTCNTCTTTDTTAPSETTTKMVDAVPLCKEEATAPVTSTFCSSLPTDGSSTITMDTTTSSSSDETEAEKRQDVDCAEDDEHEVPVPPRSSPVALKVRQTSLFPPQERSERNFNTSASSFFRVTYENSQSETERLFYEDEDYADDEYSQQQSTKRPSSQSLASSMFLVSPLRPPTRRRRVMSTQDVTDSPDFKRIVDRTEGLIQPLQFDENGNSSKPKSYQNQHQLHSLRDQASQQQTPKRTKWLIPAEHPYRILWDVLTVVLSMLNLYATHAAIRDRQFGNSIFMSFCEVWFFIDILLNFVTEYKTDQITCTTFRAVWARYLTTWFVIDVMSLFPGEALYVAPIIDQQNKRNFFQKSFFRSKAAVKVSRFLQKKHFQMFGQAVRHTKHAGVGAPRLLRILIKYIPKYWLFFRNMKGVLAIRMLRQIHWIRKCSRNFLYKDELDENGKPVRKDMRTLLQRPRPVYDDDDDDGAPF